MSQITEITEDIEVIGPGRLLSDARKNKGLSVEEVANQLNFRTGLVKKIEDDNFDKSLPATFNRGYLKSYAKLVEVAEEDVLSSYEMLGVAETQSTEMQSFSKITEKQAQNRSLMWLSYLILAVLIGSTFVWFLQYQTSIEEKSSAIEPQATTKNITITEPEVTSEELPITEVATEKKIDAQGSDAISSAEPIDEAIEQRSDIENNTLEVDKVVESEVIASTSEAQTTLKDLPPVIINDTAVFTFAGDCWVNITDATGERVAWGVKKTDYIMTIQGTAPFNVTLGKPELVSIEFSGQSIDMSQFSAGNIAKFTLPLSAQ